MSHKNKVHYYFFSAMQHMGMHCAPVEFFWGKIRDKIHYGIYVYNRKHDGFGVNGPLTKVGMTVFLLRVLSQSPYFYLACAPSLHFTFTLYVTSGYGGAMSV